MPSLRSILPRLSCLSILVACAGDSPTGPEPATTGITPSAPLTTDEPEAPTTDGPLACVPGERRCSLDQRTLLTCDDDGRELVASACGDDERCLADACLGPCELAVTTPSSIGCSFWARPEYFEQGEGIGGLIVANAGDAPATVELWRFPRGSSDEHLAADPVVLAPGETHAFAAPIQDWANASRFYTGDTYRIDSDRPIVAYQHSPLQSAYNNDAALLLPTHTLGTTYVAAAYPSMYGASYFRVIATEDWTTVEWTPPRDAAGDGLPIPFVPAGETGSLTMQRGDTLRVGASAIFEPDVALQDLSGTIIRADKPIWVLGGNPCANVPLGALACDHIDEVLFPLATWGRTYVAAHAPLRGEEAHPWRIFAGQGGVTVTSDPPLPGLPHTFAATGEWIELTLGSGVDAVFDADGPILPVHYLVGTTAGAGFGDPAMVQMVPVEQFLDHYVFATALGYETEIVQVIRRRGAAEVRVDGVVVGEYRGVGDFEIAEVVIAEGGHVAESDAPFGIIGVGYQLYTSYAYPGGMRLRPIQSP